MEKMITIAAVLLCACGLRGLTSEDIYGLASHPKVWVYGQITNARTGAPVADVSVQVEGFSTTSDRNGTWRIEGLDAADALGSASAHGFHPQAMMLALKAGANSHDLALDPQECGRFDCHPDEFCAGGACVAAATLSGTVTSACDGSPLDARVTVDGKSACSSPPSTGKPAYFQLRGLTPGGPHVLAIGKNKYQPYSAQITLQSGFNAFDAVQLEPIGGCAAGIPADEPCVCTQSNCQHD